MTPRQFRKPIEHRDPASPRGEPVSLEHQRGELEIADALKIIPLGGLEEVGRNMTVFEYKGDIVIVDVGLQFPEEDMPGIDYIIPNIEYLKGKEKQIQGIIITHGHLDHIGAVSHLAPKLGNPPIYATALSRGIILKRHDDFPSAGPLNIHVVQKTDSLTLGHFKVQFFHVNHNIPDSVGIALHTPEGLVVHTGDFKFDHSPIGDEPADLARIVQLCSEDGGVLALLSDSTNAEVPGYTISERQVQESLDEIIKQAEGRVIAATFGSLISRIQQLINIAEKYGRKLAIDGYSMRTNVEIARELGFLKVRKETIIPIGEAHRHSPEKMIIACTGAQGEGDAVLMRIAHREHKFIHIQKGDSVIFSSSVVPGNERSVSALKDILMYQGAKIFHSKLMDVHASGHAQVEDLKLMLNLVKPKHLIPIHGNHFMLRMHGEIAESVGMLQDHVLILTNGQAAIFKDGKAYLSKKRVPTNYVMVDGLGIGDVGSVVLRDRQVMAQDGIFVIISTIDTGTGKLKGNPDIISRGFVYLRESQQLLSDVRKRVRAIVEGSTAKEHTLNTVYLKDEIRNKMGQFLFSRTERRPMVIPVIIEV
ncbi:MAG: ribonuclease J [Candidatus Spechtbacteria bacterium]|nr:ribonuclease J [Candidatus Spechtbacteria bacterium]